MRKLHNNGLDEIGGRLIEKASLSEAEIDLIASSPELFDGVLRRLEPRASRSRKLGLYAAWSRWAAAAVGLLSVILVAIFASFYFAGRGIEVATREIQVPAAKPEEARPEITPQVISDVGITPGRAISQPIVQKSKNHRSVRKPSPQPIPEVEFYPVTLAGDAIDGSRGGRVIRVDMSRSSLFAMGVNVPLENETGSIKADLLVGPDGVTRGIRLVER